MKRGTTNGKKSDNEKFVRKIPLSRMPDRKKLQGKNFTAKNSRVNNFTKKICGISFKPDGKISNSNKFDEKKV